MTHKRCSIDIWALNQWMDRCVENTLWTPTGKSISLNLCWKVEVKVLVTLSCTCQAPLSMVFSRQEYWNGLPCPPPGNCPDPGIKPGSPTLRADSWLSEPPGKPYVGHEEKPLHPPVLECSLSTPQQCLTVYFMGSDNHSLSKTLFSKR